MSAATEVRLVAQRCAFGDIPAAAWDALVDSTPWASPFARHRVQRAWWDAYGATAHDQTLVIVEGGAAPAPAPTAPAPPAAAPPAAAPRIVGIVPLMHRHELEPGDVAARTTLRHSDGPPLRAVPESATAVFFGASYHADYATVLAAPENLQAVCEAAAEALAAMDHSRWDVVDLRRLRAGDPATDALAQALEWQAPKAGWVVTREPEDVCPVLTLAPGGDFEAFLASLDKKQRHEIRRKLRRLETVAPFVLEHSANPLEDLDAFIDLHQKRWGADGLFPPTEGGAASRRFFAGLFEDGADSGLVDLSFLSVGGRRIAAGVTFDDGHAIYYYNAGVDPDARDLSPGVVMVACYIQRAIELGRTRLDFMRGNEPYKYEWGAVDTTIERLLVRRTDAAAPHPDAAAPARAEAG